MKNKTDAVLETAYISSMHSFGQNIVCKKINKKTQQNLKYAKNTRMSYRFAKISSIHQTTMQSTTITLLLLLNKKEKKKNTSDESSVHTAFVGSMQ